MNKILVYISVMLIDNCKQRSHGLAGLFTEIANFWLRRGKSALKMKQRLPGGHIRIKLLVSYAKPSPVINIQTETRCKL